VSETRRVPTIKNGADRAHFLVLQQILAVVLLLLVVRDGLEVRPAKRILTDIGLGFLDIPEVVHVAVVAHRGGR
jgi:hypothetical protein